MKRTFTKTLISIFVFTLCCFSAVRVYAQTEQDGTEAQAHTLAVFVARQQRKLKAHAKDIVKSVFAECLEFSGYSYLDERMKKLLCRKD